LTLLLAVFAFWLLTGSSNVAASAPQPPTPPSIPVVTTPEISTPSLPSAGNGDAVDPFTPSTSGSSTTATTSTSGSSADSGDSNGDINISLPDVQKDSKNPVVIILLLTVISIAPSLLVLLTSFTRIVIVLSLTRNALGIPSVPPQQVIVGLSIFLTLFVMGPTLSQMKAEALDPLLDGKISTEQALHKAEDPLKGFLLKHTGKDELKLFLDASKTETPVAKKDVPLTAVIPAFVLSELKTAFIMGFVIFVPFLVIDLVVSSVLMGLGMMMLPPSFVSLPFKLLLFVLLDGWMLIVGMLLTSYH
jgi:flagellar biosynthesis protein FliP